MFQRLIKVISKFQSFMREKRLFAEQLRRHLIVFDRRKGGGDMLPKMNSVSFISKMYHYKWKSKIHNCSHCSLPGGSIVWI